MRCSLIAALAIGGLSQIGWSPSSFAQTYSDGAGSCCDVMDGCDEGGCDSLYCDDEAGHTVFGFTLGGWVAAGTTINSRRPLNPSAGFGNLPVTFN